MHVQDATWCPEQLLTPFPFATMSKPLAQASSSGSLQSVPPFSSTSQARLQALYSDFSRHKQSNTTSWNSNIDWWRNALQTIVANGLQKGHQDTRLVLHASQGLMDALKIPAVGKPAALGAIVVRLFFVVHCKNSWEMR